MGGLVLVRLAQGVPTLLGVTLVAFILLQLSGDPAYFLLPAEAGDETRQAFRQAYGFDQPIPIQYARYLARLVQGDFGNSFAFNRPAMQVVLERFPATLLLATTAMVVALLIAIPVGILSAVKRGSAYDRLAMVLVLLGQSTPTFWLGLILILVFGVHFRLLPVSGYGSVQHLIMPSLAIASYLLALTARLTRSGMLEVLTEDYIRTARAKGLSERSVALRHALKNVLIPIVTVVGLQMGGLLGGTVVIETVFAWPGIGTLVIDSILRRDYPVVLAALMLVAAVFVLINLLVDVLYSYLDPRVRSPRGG